jgi:nickel/cobalt transporter (NicO) family protein
VITAISISLIFGLLSPRIAAAHPMGQFSINQHARIRIATDHIVLTYVLDFAEVSTVQALEAWGLPLSASIAPKDLNTALKNAALEWTANLSISTHTDTVGLRLSNVQGRIVEGDAGLPVLRARLDIEGEWNGGPATITYSDRNYDERIGWKEVVVETEAPAVIPGGNPFAVDLSKGLTVYPDAITRSWPSVQRARFEVDRIVPNNWSWIAPWLASGGLTLGVAAFKHRLRIRKDKKCCEK